MSWPYVHLVWFLSVHTVIHRFALKIVSKLKPSKWRNKQQLGGKGGSSVYPAFPFFVPHGLVCSHTGVSTDSGRISVMLERQLLFFQLQSLF